jgi:hypothetical protein
VKCIERHDSGFMVFVVCWLSISCSVSLRFAGCASTEMNSWGG